MSQLNGDAPGKPFAVLDLDAADLDRLDLAGLHAQVLANYGRIELLRRGGACVLITDTVRMMRQEIALVARVATPRAQVPAAMQPNGAFNSRVRSMNLP